MKSVKVYSTPSCHFCHMAKEYFKENNVSFEDIDVVGNPEAAKEMITMSGQRGVPVIAIGEDIVVGFNQPLIAQLLSLSE